MHPCECGCGAQVRRRFSQGHNLTPILKFPTAAEWMEKFGDWFVPIPEAGCWIWMRNVNKRGYGRILFSGVRYLAHRVAYLLLRGPIPEGYEPDHLCRQPACVNPDHLEAVTHRENVIRGAGPTAVNARKIYCKNGHDLRVTAYTWSGNGQRVCRKCRNAYLVNLYARKKARRINV